MEKIKTLEGGITVAAGMVLVLLSATLATELLQAAAISSLFLLPLIVAGVNQRLYSSNFVLTVIYNIALLIFNDLLIRSYVNMAGFQNEELIALTFFVTLGVSLVPMLLHAWQTGKNRPSTNKFCIVGRCTVTVVVGIVTAVSYYQIFAVS